MGFLHFHRTVFGRFANFCSEAIADNWTMPAVARTLLAMLAIPLLAGSMYGQQTCTNEVKLLLDPRQVKQTVIALQATKAIPSNVYFFDTENLDLLAGGLVLRVRKRPAVEITVKLRPVAGHAYPADLNRSDRDGEKCEVDVNDGKDSESHSINSELGRIPIPSSGEELFRLLNQQQKNLVAASGLTVDWKRVKRLAEIQSTRWSARKERPLGKMSLELWNWQNGSVLELSTRSEPGSGQTTYAALKRLALATGISVSARQEAKTSTALTTITGARRP